MIAGEDNDDMDDDDDEVLDPTMDFATDDQVNSGKEERKKRGRTQWITPRLSAALDDAKVSSGKAVHILIATAEALKVDVSELVINRTSINEMRKKHRQMEEENIRTDFQENVTFYFNLYSYDLYVICNYLDNLFIFFIVFHPFGFFL